MSVLKYGLLSAVTASVLVVATSAFANSCTSQGASCKAWATGQFSSYKAACQAEIAACKQRCKAGDKRFVGVYSGAGGGQTYPVSECR